MILAAMVGTSIAAPAQTTPADAALAETLFQEAKRLMAAGKTADACPKFEESQRLDPGGGTLLNLAMCHEAMGRTASAWAEYGEVAMLAKQKARADIEKTARDRLTALEPKLARLTVDVPEASRVAGLEIKRGATSIAAPSWGVAVPVDPGEQELSATAPGFERWTTRVPVAAGAKQRVSVPKLVPIAVAPAASSPAPVVAAPPPSSPSSPPPAAPEAERRVPTGAWIAGGVAVVGLGVTTVFGLKSRSAEADAAKACPDKTCADADAASKAHDGVRAANVANVTGAVSLAAIGVFAYLMITAPSSPTQTGAAPVVGPGFLGGSFRGSFE
jgi:serine/threonine-protein kinase